MKVKETFLKGCFIIEPEIHEDERGYFFESFNQKEFEKAINRKVNFVQDNEAKSNKGVLRGLHYQKGESAQAKLVRVIKGSVQDIIVDLRKDSETYKEFLSIILSAKNKKQIFIPKGFAHGYLALEDKTIFAYKCDNYYNPSLESGIYFKDSSLDINWKISEEKIIISAKDNTLDVF